MPGCFIAQDPQNPFFNTSTGFDAKESCRCATTAEITIASELNVGDVIDVLSRTVYMLREPRLHELRTSIRMRKLQLVLICS